MARSRAFFFAVSIFSFSAFSSIHAGVNPETVKKVVETFGSTRFQNSSPAIEFNINQVEIQDATFVCDQSAEISTEELENVKNEFKKDPEGNYVVTKNFLYLRKDKLIKIIPVTKMREHLDSMKKEERLALIQKINDLSHVPSSIDAGTDSIKIKKENSIIEVPRLPDTTQLESKEQGES